MPTITWEKWRDPLAPLVKRRDADEDEFAGRTQRDKFLEDGDVAWDKDEKDGYSGPAVFGPMGVVPVNESNLPSRHHKFWVAHTDFMLTKRLVKAIENTLGVESLDVLTPYRFRMSVGMAFRQDDVKAAVEAAVTPKPAPPVDDTPVGTMKRVLSNSHPFWAIAVLPGGKLRPMAGGTQEEVKGKVSKLNTEDAVLVLSWGKDNGGSL